LLRRGDPHGPPYRLLELPVQLPAPQPANA
jgi:hypothetical protein